MPIVRIDSADDPRLAEFQHVPDPVLLREHGLFVEEGRFAIERLVEADVFRLRAMLVTEHTLEALTPVIGAATRDTPVYVASATHFKDIGGYDCHRGYLALAERPRPRTMASLVAALPPGRPVVVLERVGNPDNVGGIFRNAVAFGAAAVLLSPGCCDPLYRKAIRTSTGATLSLPSAVVDEWPAGLATLAERGYLVAALTPDGADGVLDTLAETARGATGRAPDGRGGRRREHRCPRDRRVCRADSDGAGSRLAQRRHGGGRCSGVALPGIHDVFWSRAHARYRKQPTRWSLTMPVACMCE